MPRDTTTETSGVENGEQPLSLETVFEVLRDRRRRLLLSHLASCTYPVPFTELVAKVVAQESDDSLPNVSDELYEQVAIDLYHVQLPKLDEYGIVDYTEDVELVTVAETLRPLDEYLRLAEQHERTHYSVDDRRYD